MRSDIPPDVKAAAVHFMWRGQMTVSQAAARAGVSREAARLWAREAGIDVEKRIAWRLDSLWRKRIMRYLRSPITLS